MISKYTKYRLKYLQEKRYTWYTGGIDVSSK